MRKIFFTFICIFVLAISSQAQTKDQTTQKSVWLVDFVKAKDGHYEDYLESLRQNWLPARVEAKKRKYVKSYKLLVLPQSPNNRYDYVLLTEFANQVQFDEREANFNKVFDKLGDEILVKGLKSRGLADIVESQNLTEAIFKK